jgi:CTP:molybdopterin cytidylyltransferase MocA
VKVIRNDHPEKGQRESVRLGVEASSTNWYLFFPCDQPLLDAETVLRIIGEAKTEGRIIQPSFRGRPGNPVLFSAAFREELLSLKEGEHPRNIKERHPDAVYSIELENETALFDADDPETLLKLERID